jgi:hypothetical protein
MGHGVVLLGTDVSEVSIASISRVEKISELGKMLAVNSKASWTSVLTRATRRHIREASILYSHRRENLKFYTVNETLFS